MDNHAISRIIYPNLSKEQIILDFYQLCLFRGEPKLKCRVGADFVNYFTLPERLNTIGREGISFIEFLDNTRGFLEKAYVQKMLIWYNENEPWRNEMWVMYRIFNLYFGSINIFQPHIAMNIYERFKPKCVLSPCAGWGGLLVAACAADVPRWIGCDTNHALKRPYMEMVSLLREHSKTEIEMNFISCMDFDYASTEYDMVFYNPPYYNIEKYTGQCIRSKNEWNEFYTVLCEISWRHLSKGGWYIVAVSNEIADIYTASIGRSPDLIVPLPNKKRSLYHKYTECLFGWQKL
jgi:16S rRNA G966 N2-methylase RsmD